jgi:hypothetical protein
MGNGPFYEPGVYVAKVVQQGLTKASTGNTQFILRFRVEGKPDPVDPESMQAVAEFERTIWMTITEKTVERIVGDLRNLGYRAESFGPLDPSHPSHESFVGNQIEVYCKHEADQSGNQRERWQLNRAAAAIEIKPLEAKEVRQLDMMFGRALKGTPSAKPTSTRTPTRQYDTVSVASDGTEITDDDIPF